MEARNVHRRINNDEGSEQPPIFNRDSQNVATAAMLVRAMPEPSTTEGRRVHGELRDLLETAVVQQAKSSTSRRRENISKRPSVHDRLKAPSVPDRLSDRREAQEDHDVVSRRRRHDNDGLARGYHPHRGGRYDSGEDRSPSPGPPGPRVFSKAIRGAPFPARFRQPANLAKYSGETNPSCGWPITA